MSYKRRGRTKLDRAKSRQLRNHEEGYRPNDHLTAAVERPEYFAAFLYRLYVAPAYVYCKRGNGMAVQR